MNERPIPVLVSFLIHKDLSALCRDFPGKIVSVRKDEASGDFVADLGRGEERIGLVESSVYRAINMANSGKAYEVWGDLREVNDGEAALRIFNDRLSSMAPAILKCLS